MDNETTSNDTRYVSPAHWLSVVETEYLSHYIPAGGSAVKVVSGDADTLDAATEQIRELAAKYSCHFDLLNPDRYASGPARNLHRLDRLLFHITAGMNWDELANQQAAEFLREEAILLRAGRAIGDYRGIAEDNGRSPDDLRQQYERGLTQRLLKDREMGLEFRAAVLALARSVLMPQNQIPSTKEAVVAWLRGAPLQGVRSILRGIQIYEAINQSNAKYVLQSLCRWL
ncbi:MAG: hypothetical protein ACP5VE_15190, partial [Chthonomonadales bacterium]